MEALPSTEERVAKSLREPREDPPNPGENKGLCLKSESGPRPERPRPETPKAWERENLNTVLCRDWGECQEMEGPAVRRGCVIRAFYHRGGWGGTRAGTLEDCSDFGEEEKANTEVLMGGKRREREKRKVWKWRQG